jgi:hypothetical protein
VTVNSEVMDLLGNVPEDQLKNHRIKKLKVESEKDCESETLARYFRLVPAITCLQFPIEFLEEEGVASLINKLKDLNELVTFQKIQMKTTI